jgi:CubicO group peptidase (beta-lactamase class C family)
VAVQRALVAGAVCVSVVTAGCADSHRPVTPLIANTAGSGHVVVPVLSRSGACASYVVVRHGSVGRSTVGLGRLTVDQALFDIGSAAKSITAAAVLLLAQQGKVDINASIGRYLEGVPTADRPVTLAQLLSHTSGLPQNFAPDTRQLGRAEAVRAILALHRRPSGGFIYSNAGYTLLAAIVESVAHQPFRSFVEAHLLRPAGMLRTGWYGTTPPGAVPVHGHAHSEDTGPAGSQAPGSWSTLGAGGMTSTASDMARWLTAITSKSLLDATTTNLMFRPRIALGQPGASAAYGWVVAQTPAGAIRLVGGETDYGYTSDLRILPRQSLAIAALSCADDAPANEIGHELQSAST